MKWLFRRLHCVLFGCRPEWLYGDGQLPIATCFCDSCGRPLT